jgi:alpha-tubulin suppressor-like RCC1 family protein
LTTSGGINCFGDAAYAQRTPPTSTNFASISLGESHGCGLTTTGAISCWGRCVENQACSLVPGFGQHVYCFFV